MKRHALFPVLLLLLALLLPAARAQEASCPVGGFSLDLPDSFSRKSASSPADPDLCFFWKSSKLTIQGYASYLGEVAGSDLFQILAGSETDTGMVTVNGMQMLYAAGSDSGGPYIMYSWMDRGNNVTLYFYYKEGDSSARSRIRKIMRTISFDAGH